MNRPKHKQADKGFALVATLLMMVLLAVVSVGLLSLSTISIRTSMVDQARRTAETNARLAVMMALGDLQKALGDDRRVTASASILENSTNALNGNLVGVWPANIKNSVSQGPSTAFSEAFSVSYNKSDDSTFKGWLVSGEPEDKLKIGYAKGIGSGNTTSQLFKVVNDGFDVFAPTVQLAKRGVNTESVAWAAIQEADKANISQPSDVYSELNDSLHSPKRPNISHSGYAKQPEEKWDNRASKVISLNQAVLDPDYGMANNKSVKAQLSRDYTVYSKGVIADVVNGGLKTDLNTAFEQPVATFAKTQWDGLANPFRKTGSNPEVLIHAALAGGAAVTYPMGYELKTGPDGRPPTAQEPVGSAASYDMLRSAYASYRHVYLSGGTPTAFYRPQVNRTWRSALPTLYSSARGSETSIAPVLDRMMYFFGLKTNSTGVPMLMITPLITLWNPYNVAIESAGYVAYPWMDMPINTTWKLNSGSGYEEKNLYMSTLLGSGKADSNHGRQLEPYFFCEMTGNGTGGGTVRLEPGEIRVFAAADDVPLAYDAQSDPNKRVLRMKPVKTANDVKMTRGVEIDSRKVMPGKGGGTTKPLSVGESFSMRLSFDPGGYRYFTTLEDSKRIGTQYKWADRGTVLTEVQLFEGSASSAIDTPAWTHYTTTVPRTPLMVAALTTFHRTSAATTVGTTTVPQADILHTVNTRQRFVNAALSGSKPGSLFLSGPHYSSEFRAGTSVASLGLEFDNGQAFYGQSNSQSTGGRKNVITFDLPRQAPISLAAFQNSDFSDSAFSTSYQFANSWASPYLDRNKAFRTVRQTATSNPQTIGPIGMGVYDYSWILNEALWDRVFMSSVAPIVSQKAGTGAANVYDNEMVTENVSTKDMVSKWIENPIDNPLRNSHMTLHLGGLSKQQVKDKLMNNGDLNDSVPLRIAEHILLQGTFNVNSTNVESWIAILSSLRGEDFNMLQASGVEKLRKGDDKIPVPRVSFPSGTENDLWFGFRELEEADIRKLATEIVVEVKKRGPFQSLAEFVNRRLDNSDLGQKGALQAAIDRAGINDKVKSSSAKFDTSKFYNPGNLPGGDDVTSIGLPGWLTQADLLTPISSIITVRSDTFRIRGYGEVKNAAGNIIASATCEAIIQRVPEYIDPADEPMVKPDNLTSEMNKTFGRRFNIVSFRLVPNNELAS